MTDCSSNNLLTVLHKWASHQDENFITDAFAHLLSRLLQFDPESGVELLKRLTNGNMRIPASEADATVVTTQVTLVFGRPDVEIRNGTQLALIESKVESGLGETQLERYREALAARKNCTTKSLVLLSRYAVEGVASDVIQKRWYEIADWLGDVRQHSVRDDVNQFLVQQFIEFLRARNITMDKVGSELPKGMHSLRSVLSMIDEGLDAKKLWTKRFGSWDSIGYFVTTSHQFVGIYFDRPDAIVFERYFGPPIKESGLSGLTDADSKKQTGWQVINELALTSPHDTTFFDLPRDDQIKQIANFLCHSFEIAAHIGSST